MFLVLCPPSPQVDYQYILLGEGDWSFNLYNINQFLVNVVLSFILIAFVAKITTLDFWVLIMISAFLLGASNIALSWTLFAYMYKPWVFNIIYGVIFTINQFAQNLLLMPIVGRISKNLPDGFESTGVTTMISIFNIATMLNGYLTDYELTKFNVKAGYYSRLKEPQQIFNIIQVVQILVAPLFLMFG